jgi:hypothetical protein
MNLPSVASSLKAASGPALEEPAAAGSNSPLRAIVAAGKLQCGVLNWGKELPGL